MTGANRAGHVPEELFDGSFAAFTETIWFVDAPFDTVAAEAIAWVTALGNRSWARFDGPLPTMLEALEPWAMPSWRQLLVETRSHWTAIFSQGADLGTHDVVGRRLRSRSLRTSYSPHIVRHGDVVSYGNCAFWLRDADETSRSIQSSFQSRWRWDLHGEQRPFEDTSTYDAKRIQDRFPLARLNEYCRALGIRRNEPDFYLPRGLVIEEGTSGWRPPRTLPRSEWLTLNRSRRRPTAVMGSNRDRGPGLRWRRLDRAPISAPRQPNCGCRWNGCN